MKILFIIWMFGITCLIVSIQSHVDRIELISQIKREKVTIYDTVYVSDTINFYIDTIKTYETQDSINLVYRVKLNELHK